jgi:hypothetical protein
LHCGRRRKRQRAWYSLIEIEVRGVEEHPSVACAILAERSARLESFSGGRLQQAEHVVVVARDALAAVPELASMIVPTAEPVQNDHLVPEGALRFDRGDAADCKIGVRQIIGGIGSHAGGHVGIERGLRAAFNLHG